MSCTPSTALYNATDSLAISFNIHGDSKLLSGFPWLVNGNPVYSPLYSVWEGLFEVGVLDCSFNFSHFLSKLSVSGPTSSLFWEFWCIFSVFEEKAFWGYLWPLPCCILYYVTRHLRVSFVLFLLSWVRNTRRSMCDVITVERASLFMWIFDKLKTFVDIRLGAKQGAS